MLGPRLGPSTSSRFSRAMTLFSASPFSQTLPCVRNATSPELFRLGSPAKVCVRATVVMLKGSSACKKCGVKKTQSPKHNRPVNRHFNQDIISVLLLRRAPSDLYTQGVPILQ